MKLRYEGKNFVDSFDNNAHTLILFLFLLSFYLFTGGISPLTFTIFTLHFQFADTKYFLEENSRIRKGKHILNLKFSTFSLPAWDEKIPRKFVSHMGPRLFFFLFYVFHFFMNLSFSLSHPRREALAAFYSCSTRILFKCFIAISSRQSLVSECFSIYPIFVVRRVFCFIAVLQFCKELWIQLHFCFVQIKAEFLQFWLVLSWSQIWAEGNFDFTGKSFISSKLQFIT